MKKKAILLVEDNRDDEALAIRALARNNVRNEIIVARDGAQALDCLLGSDKASTPNGVDLPSVVLLDLKLPKIDGLEVLRRIRRDPRTQHLPVVVLTTSREEQDLVRCYEEGCNSYVMKPVSFDEFVEAIGQLGLYWLLLNQAPTK